MLTVISLYVNIDKEMEDGKITETEYFKILRLQEKQKRNEIKKSIMEK